MSNDFEDLTKCDKEELIAKIRALERRLNQTNSSNVAFKKAKTATSKLKKEFDFSQYKTRHIMLKFLYFGWNYKGYVVQEAFPDTVEKFVFDALIKTRLVESRETCNYHRCGRTDKGVSAFSQVISLTVRSKMKRKLPLDEGGDRDAVADDDIPVDQEFDYVTILNSLLPRDIRMIAWAPVAAAKSARFDCTRRVYRYFFPQMNLEISKMNEACKFLLGEHDFRNLCKMDVNNGVVNYVRRVYKASVVPFSQDFQDPHYSMCVFQIEASAFLWHQIRYIMAVLFLVGQRSEPPSIMEKFLDIENLSSRPQFRMAVDLPLVLYEAHYDSDTVPQWIYKKDRIETTLAELNKECVEKAIQCTIIRSMIGSLKDSLLDGQHSDLDPFGKTQRWLVDETPLNRSLMDRPTCDSLEEKVSKAQKRSRQK